MLGTKKLRTSHALTFDDMCTAGGDLVLGAHQQATWCNALLQGGINVSLSHTGVCVKRGYGFYLDATRPEYANNDRTETWETSENSDKLKMKKE